MTIMKVDESQNKQKIIFFLIYLLYTHIFSKIPYSPGLKLRGASAKVMLKEYEKKFRISTNVTLLDPQNISFGENVGIARDVVLDGRGGLQIGKNTIIGLESLIITSTHKYERTDIPISSQGSYSKPIQIGDDCWIGARVILLPGVNIGKGSIIGANAVVTHDIPEYSVAAGIPCKRIRSRL
jgi:maltose O-acetyltransferase